MLSKSCRYSNTVAGSASASKMQSLQRSLHPTYALPTKSSLYKRTFRPTSLIIKAGWGDPVEFSTVSVVESQPEAQLLQRIKIDIGTLASGYNKPGQFIQAKLTDDGKPGFFALASPPPSSSSSSGENTSPNTTSSSSSSSVVELLIKAQGETAEALSNAAVGSPIQVSPVMGGGFPIDRIPPQSFPTVLIFATGSGISPIKALIESGALEAAAAGGTKTTQKRKDVRLYFGANDPSFMAYKDLLSTWESKYGVVVIPVYSDVDKKYVQDVFADDTRITEWSGVAAVLCGQKEMCAAVTDLLTSKGVDKEHILTNF